MKNNMKSYRQAKPNRFGLHVNVALYTSLMLILISLLLTMMMPLWQQPIPLHDLAIVKTIKKTLPPIVITIDEKGEYQLNTEMQSEQSMSLDAVKKALCKQFRIMDPKQTSICIRSNPGVPYAKVLEVVKWLQDVGAQHVGLLTTQASAS